MKQNAIVPIEHIERQIFMIHGQRVLLDKDLASLYGVQTRDLNKAVRRNIDRFPQDFSFQLSKEEFENLMFQIGTSNDPKRHGAPSTRWGGTRKLPRAFTEQGVAMLSSVLRSKRAVMVNIGIMRAFVRLREFLSTHKDLALKLEELERKYETHDTQIKAVFEAIRQLMAPPEKPKHKFGF
jgi:hypothetical protein